MRTLGEFRSRTLTSDWSFRKWVNLELGLSAPPYVHICDLEFLANRKGALAAEGIETAVVLENELPQLPPAKFVRQMECLPDALMVYDPIGRNSPVSWDQVLLVAAGNVQVTVFEERQLRRPRPEGDLWHPRQRLFLENFPDSHAETVSREKQAFQLMAEVLLNAPLDSLGQRTLRELVPSRAADATVVNVSGTTARSTLISRA